MADDDEDPAPDLQKLVRRQGAYSAITPQLWRRWDRANADWQARRRLAYGPAATSRGRAAGASAYPRVIPTGSI
jgi:hypothetical protein